MKRRATGGVSAPRPGAATFERFTPGECTAIVERLDRLLRGVYGFGPGDVRPWAACPACTYPMAER